jgi:hypothetical protein
VRVHWLGVRSIKALYLHFFEEFYDIGHALCSPNPEQRVVLEFLVHVDKKLEGLYKLAYHLGEFLVVADWELLVLGLPIHITLNHRIRWIQNPRCLLTQPPKTVALKEAYRLMSWWWPRVTRLVE